MTVIRSVALSVSTSSGVSSAVRDPRFVFADPADATVRGVRPRLRGDVRSVGFSVTGISMVVDKAMKATRRFASMLRWPGVRECFIDARRMCGYNPRIAPNARRFSAITSAASAVPYHSPALHSRRSASRRPGGAPLVRMKRSVPGYDQ